MAAQPAEPPAGEEDGAGWYLAQVGGDFLLYLLLNAVTAVGGFLLLPVLLHTLDRPDLGRFALVEGCLAVTLSLSLAGQKFAYLQWTADRERAEHGRLLGTVLTVCGGAALAVAAALWGLLHLPAAAALLGGRGGPSLMVLAALGLASVVNILLQTEARQLRRLDVQIAAAVVQATATVAAVFLAASHGLGVEGVLWGLFAGTLASLLVLAAAVLPGLRLGLAVAEIAPMLRYGLPIMGGLLIRFGLDAALRWMLAALVSLDVLTDYLAAAKLADLFETLFANAFFMAWGTLVYRVIRRPDAGHIVGRMTAVALRVTAAAVALLLAAAGPLFALVGGGGLHEAPRILPLLLLGKVAAILQSPLSAGLLATRRMGWQVRAGLISLLVFALLSLPLATAAGAAGLAAALALALWAATVAIAVWSLRLLPLAVEAGAVGGLAAAVALLVAAAVAGPSPTILPLAALAVVAWAGLDGWVSGRRRP